MKTILFPRVFQAVGWIFFIPSLIAGILVLTGAFSLSGSTEIIVNDAIIIGSAFGALCLTCSKEREEDEMTSAIRLHSLLTALYVYAGLLVISTILVNGIAYIYFMMVNLVLYPLIFLTVFKYKLWKFQADEDEK